MGMSGVGRLVVLVLVLSACSQQARNPVAHASANPSQLSSPNAIASQAPTASATPIASPTSTALPFPDLPLSTVAFSCRLPVYRQGSTIEDSFISFPANTVTVDPNGKNGMYLDRAYSRWLPVPRTAVSPDGAGYTYIEIGQEPDIFFIHLVGVVSGKDVAIRESASASGFGAEPQIFDYSADGVYLTEAFEHVWPGVWLFQQPIGPIHKVADIEVPEISAGSGVFWFGAVNAADPSPFSTRSSAGILPDEVNRLDLKTGTRSQWLYRSGVDLEVLGVDTSGRPLIRVLVPGGGGIGGSDFFNHSESELLLGLNTTSQRSIFKGQLVDTLSGPIADSHGVWFGSDQGIYLYSDAGGMQKVSDHPGLPANGCF